MPNWCYTNIIIKHDDPKQIEDLYNLIEKWTSFNYTDNGFGLDWLGNIVGNSGIGNAEDIHDPNFFNCRGSLQSCELATEYELHLSTETAWSPMLKMWTEILNVYLPGAELLYYAEEFGCGILDTNDPDYTNRYYVDVWGDCEFVDEVIDDATEETVVKLLQKILKTKEKRINKLLNMFEDSAYSDEMNIHKWDITDIDEWD